MVLVGASVADANLIESLISPGSEFAAFLKVNALPQPLSDGLPRSDNDANYILIDYAPRHEAIGGSLDKDTQFISASSVPGASAFNVNQVIKNLDMSIAGDISYQSREFRISVDGIINVNTLVPVAAGSDLRAAAMLANTSASPVRVGGIDFYSAGDLNDKFYANVYGVKNADAVRAATIIHEGVGHGEVARNSAGGATFRGHYSVYDDLFSSPSLKSDSLVRDFRIDTGDILADPVLLKEYNYLKINNLLVDAAGNPDPLGNYYLQKKVQVYQRTIASLSDELSVKLGREPTIADLRAADTDGILEKLTSARQIVRINIDGGDSKFSIRDFLDDTISGITIVDGGQLGQALGTALGLRLTSDPFGQVVSSGLLSTALGALGEFVDERIFGGISTTNFLNGKTPVDPATGKPTVGFGENLGSTLLANIKGAGIGALSSYLAAELFQALGIEGLPGEVADSVGGAVVSRVITNISLSSTANTPFAGVDLSLVANAVGSFIGTRLAAEIHSFDSVGGQIGAATGGMIGGFTATAVMASIKGVELGAAGVSLAEVGAAAVKFALANPVAAIAIVAGIVLLETLLGGLIGSIFGGTPRSGADTTWDSGRQQFGVSNSWSRKGGSKDAAKSLAGAVGQNLNSLLNATGSMLLDPESVQSGSYGMRKKKYTYRPVGGGSDRGDITASFSGSKGAEKLIKHGTYLALSDMVGQLAGGDIYIKRALASSVLNAGGNPNSNSAGAAGQFEMTTLLGDISVAGDYGSYLSNSTAINALIAADPETSFAAGWLITLARAGELGLNKRASTDWIGGFQTFLDEARDGALDGIGLNVSQMGFGIDDTTGLRYWSVSDSDDSILGFIEDTIEAGSQTTITGTSGTDVIDLRTGLLADQRGYTVNGHLNDDIAVTGSDFTALNSAVTFAATDLRKTVVVTLANDGVAEALETFNSSLSNAPAMQIMGSAAIATVIDGAAALPTLMVGNSYAYENDGYAVFRLSLSKASTTAITLSLTLANDKASGLGVDYGSTGAGNIQVSTNGTTWTDATSATFAAGATELFVRTAIVADNIANPAYVPGNGQPEILNVEGNERFRLNAVVTAGGSALANGTQTVSGTGTIVDGAGTQPLVWIDNVVTDEASGQAKFTISRSRTLASSTTVNFATSDRRVLNIDIAATVDGGGGNDTIYASNLGDNIFGGAGNDTLYGGRLDDWLLGGDGDDVIDAGTQDANALGGDGNYLDGGAGNDILKGREGSDWLEGGDGIDTLAGGAGDDILAGGAGEGDSLKGGSGSDQYLVRRGDGADIAEEDATGAPASTGAGDAITQRMAAIAAGSVKRDWVGASAGVQGGKVTGGEDAIVFGAGIGIGDIKLQRSGTSAAPGNDLLVIVMTTVNGVETDSGTRLVVKDWFTNPFKRIEWLKFADGNEIRVGDITSFVGGGAGNDVLVGTVGNDFVYGGAGNDKLYLLGGSDIGNGGTGDDMVAGDTGRDLLIGGLGNDELMGGAGWDAITGDDGADDIYGGADRDVLSGGRGDGDLVVGGAGDDTFKYARGDGQDTYFDEFANYWSVVWTAAGSWNTAAGFSQNTITGEVTGPGGVLIRRNFGTAAEPDLRWLGRYDYDSASQTLKLFTPPANASTITANAGVDTIEFAPGINIQDVILRRPSGTNDLVLAISSENEELSDTSLARDSITIKDWYLAPGQIEKLAFYQTGVLDITASKTSLIAGTDGADGTTAAPLTGTAIADWITGGAGDDVIAGGEGNDILAGNSGFDTLRGESGDDVLYGGAGNDMLDGGSGKDVLVGGAGEDTASYASSTSAVRVALSAAWSNSGAAAGDEYYSIENILGGSGSDTLLGDAGQNEITGGAGYDALRGGYGDDTYIWNVGDGGDTIYDADFVVEEAVTTAGTLSAGYSVKSWAKTGTSDAATGNLYWRLQIQAADGTIVYDNATYSYAPSATPAVPTPSAYIQAGWLLGFSRSSGQQVTRSKYDSAVNAGDDELEFGQGISLNDLTFIRNGNDLVVRYGGSTASQVTIQGQLLTNSAIETLKLNDGLSLSLSSILVASSATQVVGTAADDLIVGRTGTLADNLSGGDGNDVLVGYAGDDLLYGGNGDDVFEGGLGADRLEGGANSLASDGPEAGDTARYVRSAAAVAIDLTLVTAQGGATGSDSIGDILVGIENVVGSAFGDTLTGDANDNRLFGLEGADTLRGGAGNDIVVGDAGNDVLYGDAGEDGLAGGDGDDTLYGGSENDQLDGGEGNDNIYGEAGDDTLTGQAGADLLDGGDGNDKLVGGSGGDQLIGGVGDDTLAGGTGNDNLQGGVGNDSYAFDAWSGSDTLIDTDGSNVVTFDSSVAYDRLWLTRVGNDLRVAVIGGDTQITVTGFFLGTGQSRIHAMQTTTHVLFLDHPDTLNLVNAMTAATTTPSVTPVAMPGAVTPLLATYWHAGDKAAPTGPATPRALTLAEDAVINVDGAYGVIDHDQNVTGYSLKAGSGPALGTISNFNPATGALTYTPFADANGADSFVVIATDADGHSVELVINVTINPVNDAPRNIAVGGGGSLTVLESAPASTTSNGTVIGQFTALDVEGDTITYSLADNAGGRFTITATGELRVLNASLLDREASASHVIQVKATDALGAATTTAFTVLIGNVNEAPNAPVLGTSRGIASEFVSGVSSANVSTWVANFTTSDPDGAPAPALAFVADATGNPGNRFKIVGNQIQFAVEPDFEALSAAGFAIADSDGDGLGEITLTGKVVANDGSLNSAASTSFSVRIEDVNQQQTAITLGGKAASIDERDRLAAGTARPAVVLGALSVTDPDLPGQLTGQHSYTVFEGASTSASTRFAVNASNQLVLLANQSLDFETDGASITLRVRAKDKSASPLSLDQTFSFSIANVDDVIDGTASADTLTGQQNRDILRGLAGDDILSGLAGNDQLEGGDGNDTLNGGDGDDTLLGQTGNDTLAGDAGNDTLSGGDGDDVLNGGVGDDTLNGDAGNDGVRAAGSDVWRGFVAAGLVGGDGNDTLNGGDGDDYLEGGLGADQLSGGLGFDGVSYQASTAAVTVNLALGTGAGGSAQGDTLTGIELVQGSAFADTITGSAGDDVLYGGDGNDTIRGGAGNDHLLGGAGDDYLDAEAGDDFLDGGAGNDIMIGGTDNDVYFIGRNQGSDRIRNFDSTGANFDQISFDATILYTDVWFDRVDDTGEVNASGAHLRMTVLGQNGPEGTAIVENWYISPDHGLPDSYFKIDLISDGAARAALPVNVDALVSLMAGIPVGSRPTTQAQMTALRSGNQNFSNGMEDYWGRLSAPKISDTVAISGVEPLDNGSQTVSFTVRAWFQDDQGLGITIPASQIDLTLTATGGNVLSNYVTAVNYGTPDASGNRTVTLTLAPNASTHLLPGGTLPLQLQAQIRGTTRTALDAGGIALTISPTADTASFTQLASTGGNAGTYIPLSVAATSPDVDGSERVDILIKGLPSGYSLTNSAGTAVGAWDATNNWWRLTTAQLSGLRLSVPAGRYENAPLQFAAQSIDGSSTRTSAWSALTIIVNGAPTNVTLAGSVAENAGNGTFVGTLTGIDPDTSEGVAAPSSFQLLNDAGGRYRLDPADSSRLLVNNGGANLDFEAANRDVLNTITVRVTDGNGLFRDVSLVVPVTNVNETPNAPGGGSTVWSFFDETGLGANPAVGGAGVASFGLSDPDGGTPALQFAPGGNPNNWFTIAGNQVRFSAGTSYDFEWFRANGYGIYDWNGDGRLDAHIADVTVRASDGALTSGNTLLQVFISDVNERPNNLIIEAANLFSETLNGDTSHSGQLIARFTMADPDGPSPNLVIVGGNQNGWFQSVYGNHLAFSPGVNFTADWLRANKGQWGTDADFYYDTDGDGLKEIRVATLTLRAQDANGAQSDPFTYNVFIEDKNEAPVWAANPFTFGVNENPAWYQYVGAVSGWDIDGPTSELRYVFSNWNRYYDGNLGTYVSLTPDSRFVMTDAGAVYVNGGQAMDFETGQRNFSYQTLIYDKAFGANNAYNYGTININLQDVDEPHYLVNGSFDVYESDTAQGPQAPLRETNGTVISLAQRILNDPEQGRNIRWQFTNGTADSGPWHIESDGTLRMYQGVNYEAVAAVYTPVGYPPYTIVTYDPNRAIYSLGVQAIDVVTGQVQSSTVTLAVKDYNESPIVSMAATGAKTALSNGVFQIYTGQTAGAVATISGIDPERAGGVTYQITTPVFTSITPWTSVVPYTGVQGDTPVSVRPTVSIDSAGRITLGSAWNASYAAVGGPPNYQLSSVQIWGSFKYEFNVIVRDAAGNPTYTPIVLQFMDSSAVKPPLIFDLDGDGLELTSFVTSTVAFDMNGDGQKEKSGWVGPDDGFLALDRNGNGLIDDISEISFVADTEGALSDLEGLRAFDTNGDGFFDSDDDQFGDFRIWQDANSDGISQEEELRTLSERGIDAINLTLTVDEAFHDPRENYVYGTTEYIRADGSRGAVGDVFLASELTMPVVDPSSAPVEEEELGLAAPIVFDYDGDGAGLVALSDSNARFDMNRDGVADKTGWIEQGDALLALDRNGNGTIDDISEISFVGDKAGAKTDLEGLAAFDSNADGVLDGEDDRFVEFRLWFDRNGNGTTDAGELLSLAEAGIKSIGLTGQATGQTVTQGANIVYNIASYTYGSGLTGQIMDAGFAFKPLSKLPEISFQTSEWKGKSRKYELNSSSGRLHVRRRDADNPLNPGAGQIAPAAIVETSNGFVGMLSTIIVDLDNDGLEARRMKKTRAAFDMDGDTIADDTGWVSGGDGLLVIDRDGDGRITGPSEISFLSEKADAKSAWDALAVLDNNRDGKLSSTDARFGELKVWKDENSNGVSEEGELKTLADLGIKEIGLATAAADSTVRLGYNIPLSTALFTRENGVTGTIGNVALAFDPSSADSGSTAADVTSPPALATQTAASQLLQAMSSFGAAGSDGSLQSIAANGQNSLDLLAASAA
ncbi:Calx-beta domain-containing protein [Sphingobium agri]|uniref:Calx-beta domain-containing protein n=1 Tax=Sphingobium TaxID=165695 RepID=UPI001FF20B54|nr:Calx-beta domain-containing protein [Sphingobium agri]